MTFLNFKGGHIPLSQIFTPVGRKNFSYAGTLAEINKFFSSADEKLLAIGTERTIYTLNLETGQISEKFEDKTFIKGGLHWGFNALQFSPSNRFIVFVKNIYCYVIAYPL